MKSLRLGLLIDIARLARPSVPETLKLLKKRHKSRAPFTYRTARNVAISLWSGDIKLPVAESAVEQTKMSELGKACNLEVIRLTHKFSEPFDSICRTIRPQPYPISQDAYIPVPIDFYFLANGVPHLFMLQPRRSHAPDDRALGLIAGIVEEVYIPDVFDHAELYLFDLKSANGGRVPRVLGFSDLPRLPQEEIRHLLEIYLEAHEQFQKWVAEQPREDRQQRRKKPGAGPDQLDLPL